MEKTEKAEERMPPIHNHSRERGVTIIETLIASLVMIVGVVSTMGVFSYSVGMSKDQGDITSRAITYSQDKMEQLMSLNYTDASTDTTSNTYPMPLTGGTGLGGDMAANTSVGSLNTSSPTTGYVDYITFDGVRQTTSTGAFYVRAWQISIDSSKLKTMKVVTVALGTAGGRGVAPQVELVCQKSDTR
jgi:Tfp pilus assembly protein PilV